MRLSPQRYSEPFPTGTFSFHALTQRFMSISLSKVRWNLIWVCVLCGSKCVSMHAHSHLHKQQAREIIVVGTQLK